MAWIPANLPGCRLGLLPNYYGIAPMRDRLGDSEASSFHLANKFQRIDDRWTESTSE